MPQSFRSRATVESYSRCLHRNITRFNFITVVQLGYRYGRSHAAKDVLRGIICCLEIRNFIIFRQRIMLQITFIVLCMLAAQMTTAIDMDSSLSDASDNRRALLSTPTDLSRVQEESGYVGNFNEEMAEAAELTGVTLSQVSARWPRIVDIGRYRMQCTNSQVLPLLQCAFYVLQYPDQEDRVSPIVNSFSSNKVEFFNSLYDDVPKFMYSTSRVFSNGPGATISLLQAFQKSFSYRNDDRIFKKLQVVCSSLHAISDADVMVELSKFAELSDFKHEQLCSKGKYMGETMKSAVRMMLVPTLNTAWIRESLDTISQGFVDTKGRVDDYIDQHFPFLSEFKNVGDVAPADDQLTTSVTYLAKLALNPALNDPRAQKTLTNWNVGAESIAETFDQVIATKYGYCRNTLSREMKNIAGEGITFHSAIKFTMIPQLDLSEKLPWEMKIEDQLKALGCDPEHAPVQSKSSQNLRQHKIEDNVNQVHEQQTLQTPALSSTASIHSTSESPKGQETYESSQTTDEQPESMWQKFLNWLRSIIQFFRG